MKKKIVFSGIIIICVLTSLGVVILTDMLKKDKVDYYNECLLISANVFLRVNTLPVKESIDEVLFIESKLENYHKDFIALRGPKNTENAAKIMNRLFESSFEVVDLVKKFKYGEEKTTHFMYLQKLQETQEIYLEFAAHLDDMEIPIFDSTTKSIEKLTIELIDGNL